jgi:hypothetical protein
LTPASWRPVNLLAKLQGQPIWALSLSNFVLLFVWAN